MTDREEATTTPPPIQLASRVLEFSLTGADDWYRWPHPPCTLQEAAELVRELNERPGHVQYRHVSRYELTPAAVDGLANAKAARGALERVAFEAEVRDLFSPPVCLQRAEDGEYLDPVTRDLWLGWVLRAFPATPPARQALGLQLENELAPA